MTTIRIADAVHPNDELRPSRTQEGISSGVADSIYTPHRFGRSDTIGSNDGIYNIRSRSKAPSLDRRSARKATGDFQDEDPGLRRDDDYKQRQVESPHYQCVPVTWTNDIRYSKVGSCYGLPINP